ncbi:hypothetical protein OPKNFCMD_6373 [Methylobacterium crusticola]|uniref:Uncharacterized protein n=1 Tax=Methylobacterium crusticola TaxID=1697972 RepID=A0ABQ4R7B7_9HYPH|nr:hypothetical protein [Methylobacterium crusticola]GJD53596.1 hypothetical protein OPKNFCMD_6373 [Methylobacterium crusticola]
MKGTFAVDLLGGGMAAIGAVVLIVAFFGREGRTDLANSRILFIGFSLSIAGLAIYAASVS